MTTSSPCPSCISIIGRKNLANGVFSVLAQRAPLDVLMAILARLFTRPLGSTASFVSFYVRVLQQDSSMMK